MAATVDKDRYVFHFVSTIAGEVYPTHSMAKMVSLHDVPDGGKFPINYHVVHFIALSC